MSDTIRYEDQFTVKYVCGGCGMDGVKLWRLGHAAFDSLLCVACTCAEQNAQGHYEHTWDWEQMTPEGRIEGPYGLSDQIGDRLPAVPVGDTYWGYTSVPDDGVAWWRGLPLQSWEVVELEPGVREGFSRLGVPEEPDPEPIEFLPPDPLDPPDPPAPVGKVFYGHLPALPPLLERRERPPPRRHLETRKVELFGRSYHLSVGRYPDGRPCEVFARGAKAGSEMDALLDDACILVSMLLQLGASLDSLADLFARDGESVVGALVRELQAAPLNWPVA